MLSRSKQNRRPVRPKDPDGPRIPGEPEPPGGSDLMDGGEPENFRYTYDHENRLVRYAPAGGGQDVRYKFDALDRRVERNLGSGTELTKFTHDGEDVVLDDIAGTLTKYQNGPGIDNKLSIKNGSSFSYFLADHLGSTNGLADQSGTVSSSTDYDSFGNPTNTSFPSRYQFTGREFDSFSGLQFSRARWYDPVLGRFISEDPIGLAGGINQYSYVSNNPTNAVDPLGLYEIDVHYYMTYYLAMKTGCFSATQSMLIANGNQMTDEAEAFSPDWGKAYQNSAYHALDAGTSPGFGSAYLEYRAKNPLSYVAFGRSLHYAQDTYSHAGYHNPYYGHMSAGHFYDKTNSDPARAVRMARDTWDRMVKFANSSGCECKPLWTTDMSATILAFVLAPGSANPSLNAIDSTGGSHDFFITNPPEFLKRKRQILGVPRR